MKFKIYKRSVLIAACLPIIFMATALAGAPAFTLKGKLSGKHVDSVFLRYANDTSAYNYVGAAVVDNEFTITGQINAPVPATISFKTNGISDKGRIFSETHKVIYLEPTKMTLTGDPENIQEMVLTGSVTETQFGELEKQTADLHREMDTLNHRFERYRQEKNKQKISEIHSAYEACEDTEIKMDYQFFLRHPNSYVTANKILSYTVIMGVDSLEQVYNNYGPAMKNSPLAKKLYTQVAKIKKGPGTPGSMAPDFVALDMDGKSLSLLDLKGKYIIIDFWASWCAPCRAGNPHMIALFNRYKAKGFDVVSVSGDDVNIKAWIDAVEQDHIGIWHQLLDSKLHTAVNIMEKYNVRTLPAKILIDPFGKVIGRYCDNLGGSDADMDKMLNSIFNK